MYLSGQHFSYYIICKTKLWLHHHRLIFADENQNVQIGRIIDEKHFKQDNKVNLGFAVADFIDITKDKIIISEVKKSNKMSEAHKLQLLHFMYIINTDDKDIIGKLRYPTTNKIIRLELDADNITYYINTKNKIKNIISGDMPNIEWKNACKSCSMREFCHS